MGTTSSVTRPRRVSGSAPARSVRVGDEVWGKSRSRADYEGVTISHVINALLEGYSKGLLDLPKVTVQYGSSKSSD